MNLTPEEKEVGKENYYSALDSYDQSPAAEPFQRRDFLKGVVGAGIVSGAGLGATYFWRERDKVANPVRVAIIGTGDEGQVLIGACNPKYVDVVAISDIRPYNVHRAFHGHWGVSVRPGLIKQYGFASEDDARKHVKIYENYLDAIKDPNVEAVIIALPLFLHAPAAIVAMQAGKHVLTEKLMAHNVAQCKLMGRVAEKQEKVLAVGHQRHYSVLYDNAVNLIRWGVLGEIHHIRAQWHRGNLPGRDSWQQPLPFPVPAVNNEKERKAVERNFVKETLDELNDAYKKEKDSAKRTALEIQIAETEAWLKDAGVKAENFGYQEFDLGDGRKRSALEELCRWRLFNRTGGGLMAELGSHQLDAASIFVSALRRDGKKAHPLSVYAVGGRHTFPLDREAEDHVYCMFEFPGPGYEPSYKPGYFDPAMNYPDAKGIASYEQDPSKRIVVTYSSINGNGWGGYGETVMGSKGTLILEREQEVLLYKSSDTTTKIGVKDDKGGPTLDTQASGKGPSLAKAAATSGPVSRGYTEEIEHWAWCIRNPAPENQPRCSAKIALGDAVIALAANVAIANANSGKGGYLAFQEDWYDIHKDATPDGSDIAAEAKAFKADV